MPDSRSTVSSFQNIASNNNYQNFEEENDNEPQDPNKFYESAQITIDENDSLETRIHEWLDKQKVYITCPSSKMHDYYDCVRQRTFQDIQSLILQSESDLDKISTPSNTTLHNQQSTNESSYTPQNRMDKRQLGSLQPNFLNRRRLTQKIDEKKPKSIEELHDEWDQVE